MDLSTGNLLPFLTMIVYHIVHNIAIGRIAEYSAQYLLNMYIVHNRQVWYNYDSGGGDRKAAAITRKELDYMAEKKSYYSPAQNKATQRFLDKEREQVRFWVRKGELSDLQTEAENNGQSMAAYIIKAVNDRAGRQILTPAEGARGRKRTKDADKEGADV